MDVEGASRAKALLKPRNRMFTYGQGLFDHEAQESAERSDDEEEKDQECHSGGERLAATKKAHHPAIERVAEPRQDCPDQ